ncbi:MAG: hypothetical protein A3G76_16380 [Acidobacteria bacterium RIFCSPLOWO2_12_FULL_65_11]|nr:MAG: hypothetical protein A3H95_10695 [Acidobacteria bacterium RIFCSPLOWO2_02_FULL_64_15]OFW32244.1 MAG: hypothetical protein A3G76_16380 [Acidobacteria bacterium RIFCSPLOWO2_12_FULL_65_11]
MAHPDGPLIRRVVTAWLVALVVAFALPAAAQDPMPPGTVTLGVPVPGLPRAGVEFLTRYDFHLSAAALVNDDKRFSWDTHFGGELDAVDYIVGRTSIRIDYGAVLGNELRAFDPNQGNYTLELSTSARSRVAEIAVVFHHKSRHLGDRDKTVPIAWNLLGVRVLRQASAGPATVEMDLTAGRIVQHSSVDYTWIGDTGLVVRRPLVPRAGLYVRGVGQFVGVSAAINARGAQAGGLVETGVRLKGEKGAIDLFLGYERRVDAAPLDRQPQTWIFVGFRLVGG